MNSISLTGKPLDIPDFIEINVTKLGIGDSLKCSDLEIPAGIKMNTNENATCVSVSTATALPEEEEEVVEEAAEATPEEEAAPAAE